MLIQDREVPEGREQRLDAIVHYAGALKEWIERRLDDCYKTPLTGGQCLAVRLNWTGCGLL
jgi:hypothetical protein